MAKDGSPCERMAKDGSPPTRRSIGLSVDEIGQTKDETGSGVTSIPWVDIHQHTQTLSWNDQEKFSLSGCEAAVMIAANYHWSPYRPVVAEDVRFLWDLALKWTDYLNQNHLFDTKIAVAIHTLAKVEDTDSLLDVLPEYCALDDVVAVGESGIEPVQYTSQWPVKEQKPIVREQMRIAAETDLPFILHTPTKKSTTKASAEEGWGGLGMTQPDSEIDYSQPKIEATELDVELKDEAGLPDEQLLIDHGDSSIVEFVMESTDCYLGFSVSSPLKGVTTEDIVDTIEQYGPERVVIDSDMMGYRDCDLFCMARTIQDLYRAGISVADIRTVVYDNPRSILGLGTDR